MKDSTQRTLTNFITPFELTIFQVRQHISSFPSEVSHYSRIDAPHKKYISADLSVNRMWRHYLAQDEPDVVSRERQRITAQQENTTMLPFLKPDVTYYTYGRIFNTEVINSCFWEICSILIYINTSLQIFRITYFITLKITYCYVKWCFHSSRRLKQYLYILRSCH